MRMRSRIAPAILSLVLLALVTASGPLPSLVGHIGTTVTGTPAFAGPVSGNSAAQASPSTDLFPVLALGAHPERIAAGGGCDDCAYYMQEGTTLLQACESGVSGSCTTTGLASIDEDVAVQSSPYATGVELNGLTNTGDWIQSTVLLNWCGSGYYVAQEAWNSEGDSGPVNCFSPFTISAGNTIELGLSIPRTGADAGDDCISATDLTTKSTTFSYCVAQPDPGSSPTSNYFELGASGGYFTGPMTEIVDTSATSCLNYNAMPEVTYNFVSGNYITQFSPWSDEWNPSSDAICYSTVEDTPWTMSPGVTTIQVWDASAASTYGPHWQSARNTSSPSATTWWAFSTDYVLPTPTVTPPSADVGESTPVVFNEPVEIEHIDTNPTYEGWSTPSSVLSGCVSSDGGETYTCSPTGPAGAVSIKFDVGETGGYELFSPTITYNLYADPTVAVPTANRTGADVGQSVTFTATPSGGSGDFSYAWLGLPTGCSGVVQSVSCTDLEASGPSTVSVEVTDSNGFSTTSGTLTFLVDPDPTVTPATATPSTVDLGQSAIFAAVASGGAGGFTYLWTGLPTGCAGATTSVTCVASVATAGTEVSLTVTDANGFHAASASVLFIVYPTPTITLSVSPSSAAAGTSVQLKATTSGGAGGWHYVWTGLPGGCSSVSSASISCSPLTDGTFHVVVTATDSDGGVATGSATLSVTGSTLLGLPASEGYTLVILLVAVAAVGVLAAALLARRRRRKGPGQTTP